VPGFDSVYMATGAGRKGVLLGPAMGRAVADLILTGKSTLALEAFSPARFARAPR
jgi:glycine/D-amino acid oxidase-like deaminating enzyme